MATRVRKNQAEPHITKTVDSRTRESAESESYPLYLKVLLTAEGAVRSVSASVTPLLGYTPDEIAGQPLDAIAEARDGDTLAHALNEVAWGPHADVPLSLRLRGKDGTLHGFEGRITNLLDVPGIAALAATLQLAGVRGPSHEAAAPARQHVVQFYETDDFLADSLCAFVTEGLAASDACLLIGTPERRASVESRLRERGIDVAAVSASGDYTWLDAEETLTRFMRDGLPHTGDFMDAIGGIIGQAADGGRHVRVFGEMVALLWANGNHEAAIRLEELWNDLQAADSRFWLCCAYPMRAFVGGSHGNPFAAICDRHSRVVPDESYSALTGLDDRLRAITRLQQKALSLDAETAERKRAEVAQAVALAQEEAANARLRAVLDVLPVGVALCDAEGRVLQLNAAFRDVWGADAPLVESAEHHGEYQGWRAGTGERLRPEDWTMARALRLGKPVIGDEIDILSFDGKRKNVLVSAVPIHDATGKLTGGVLAELDITERRRLERRTRESLEALLAMAEALVSPDAPEPHAAEPYAGTESPMARRLVVLTRQVLQCEVAAIVGFNPKTLRLWPVAVDGILPEYEAQWWRDVPRTPLSGYYAADVVERLRRGETVLVDFEEQPLLNHVEANYGVRRVLIVPMRIAGRVVGLLPIEHRDRHRAYTADEVALVEGVAKLAALVVERERLLREREEARADAIALRRANARMDEFLGIASHELRTPLTTIQANIQIVSRRLARLRPEDLATEDAERVVETVKALLDRTGGSAKRLGRLVNDLLDVSRIQASKLELQPERVDLGMLVRDVVEEQRLAYPERTIRLKLPANQESVTVVADVDRISQVLTNYLSNALKYSHAEEPVDVSVGTADGQAVVSVRDRGMGISPEEQEHVWELFYRAPGATQRSGSSVGLGLGLRISRELVERHGGTTGVESVPGEGSTFWFSLPLAR